MNYQNALNYLEKIPMFQKNGATAYNPSLDKINLICERLDYPHTKFKSIHIAGTNGKGSVSNLIASVLETKKMKTALYTSPHLLDFRERMTINGKMIPKEEVVYFVENNKNLIDEIKPSFFEVTTAMAFWWFAKQEVDIAVIECGMGGRFDATNIITPLISTITNISKDHTAILGDSLSDIAKEKSGIIKPQIPVVIGEWNSESSLDIISKAKYCDSEVYIASQRYEYIVNKVFNGIQTIKYYSPLEDSDIEISTNLLGCYQIKNIATALTVLDILEAREKYNIKEENIEKGFLNCRLKARYQQICDKPRIICDTGHNEAGIKDVILQLVQEEYEKLWVILGVVDDKDINSMLELFPKNANYIFTKSSVARALNENKLRDIALLHGLNGDVCPDVDAAIETVFKNATTKDLIFIGGSTFTVADAIKNNYLCGTV